MHKRSLRAFFSIDAAFALLMVALAFIIFSLLASSAAAFASSSAAEVSKTNLALRLSSYIINDAAAQSGGIYPDNYVLPGELDTLKLQMALDDLVSQGKVRFAKVTVKDGSGSVQPFSAGTQADEAYCVQRLALISGELALLEVCVS